MANCPKCNHHLRVFDWKQKCPYCGANIVLYDLQERLMADADVAEVQNYHFQKKIDRLKASFAGSKLAIVRIFTSVLPIAALFLPLVNAQFSYPMPDKSGNIDALKIYKMFDKIDFGALLGTLSDGGAPFVISAVLLLLGIVLLLLHIVLLTLACSPKGKVRNYTLDIMMLVFAIASAVCFTVMPEGSFAYGSLGIGTYLYIALLIVNFAVDIAVFKQGIEVHHKQCYVGGIPIEEYFEMVENGTPHEEIRQEMYRRLTALQAQKDAEIAEAERKRAENETKEEAKTR